MTFPLDTAFFRTVLIGTAVMCAAVSCAKPKEQDTAAASLLPVLTSAAELDSALAKAGDRMLLLDFYASWCKPCWVLTPVIEELAVEYKERHDFFRVNVDKSPGLARAFGVRGIPFVVFMRNGKAVYAVTGVHPKETYVKVLTVCGAAASADDCFRLMNGPQ